MRDKTVYSPPIIGFLAPDGTFSKCDSHEHYYCAMKICESLGKGIFSGGSSEDYLLSKGYIIFRARDAYRDFHPADGKYTTITENQVTFINSVEEWNNDSQEADVYDMLKFDGKLRLWIKHTARTAGTVTDGK
jgi:hypothetical protein